MTKMTEKNRQIPLLGMRPVPMKLFATWEVDRTPPNCIPRLCSLTLTRLVLVKSLGADLTSIVIAVKMQGSKRTLRSHELVLPPNGLLDTELQLSFSLQESTRKGSTPSTYPHFLKRDGNRLHVMLQRRKRYKNRAILGYKTLAEGVINMSQVLQHQMEMELDLMNDCKESKGHNVVVAKISVSALNSQPVDHEETNKSAVGRGVPDFSDEEEDFSSGNDDGEGEGSDSEPMIDERRRGRNNKMNGNVRQRNLKQKFISLLKRFRVNEDLQSLDNDQETISRKLSVRGDMDAVDIEDLFEELDDLSDSGPEIDTMSISSTPKPSLRPFFSSSRSLLHDNLNTPGRLLHKKNCHNLSKATMNNKHAERNLERVSDESSKRADSDSHPDNWTDSDPPPPTTSPPKGRSEEKDRKSKLFARDRNHSSTGKSKKQGQTSSQNDNSFNMPRSNADLLSPGSRSQDILTQFEVRKSVTDQISRLFPSEDGLPEILCLVHAAEPLSNQLANILQGRQYKVISLTGSSDIRTCVTFLVNKMQKFCNSCPKPPPQMKLLLAGSDSFVNTVLRHYIDQLSSKPSDWISYIRFYVIPLVSSYLSRYLGSLDNVYNLLFITDSWKERLENADCDEIGVRIQRYLQQASSCVQLPISEAMLTCKENSLTEESSQIFIPFIMDVRLGNTDFMLTVNSSVDTIVDENQFISTGVIVPSTTLNISSPPCSAADRRIEKPGTPPSSPNINYHITSQYKDTGEPLELQIDYWLLSSRSSDVKNDAASGKKNDSGKLTLKTAFRSLQVAKLQIGELPATQFSITYTTKEKKQKIMRLGKKKEKEKDLESKSQNVDGIYRLICSPRTQNVPLVVNIDGNEWTGVKFFQLSSQWQTHVRNFPIILFNCAPDSNTI